MIRLSGVYALAQIASGYSDYRNPIVEILAAFVRENVPLSNSEDENSEFIARYRNEIQAILRILSELNRQPGTAPSPVNRRGTNLRGMDFSGASLSGVILESSNLEQANLQSAVLSSPIRRADLRSADLDGANLDSVHLEGARLDGASMSCITPEKNCVVLVEAHFEGAILAGANMRHVVFTDTYLHEADLDRAHLEGANLSSALGLRQSQVSRACTDEETILPEGLLKGSNSLECGD